MIDWDNVVSAVATEEGLVVTERQGDGTLGAPQVYAVVVPRSQGVVVPQYTFTPCEHTLKMVKDCFATHAGHPDQISLCVWKLLTLGG